MTLAEGRDGGEQSSSNSVNLEVTMVVVSGVSKVFVVECFDLLHKSDRTI